MNSKFAVYMLMLLQNFRLREPYSVFAMGARFVTNIESYPTGGLERLSRILILAR